MLILSQAPAVDVVVDQGSHFWTSGPGETGNHLWTPFLSERGSHSWTFLLVVKGSHLWTPFLLERGSLLACSRSRELVRQERLKKHFIFKNYLTSI